MPSAVAENASNDSRRRPEGPLQAAATANPRSVTPQLSEQESPPPPAGKQAGRKTGRKAGRQRTNSKQAGKQGTENGARQQDLRTHERNGKKDLQLENYRGLRNSHNNITSASAEGLIDDLLITIQNFEGLLKIEEEAAASLVAVADATVLEIIQKISRITMEVAEGRKELLIRQITEEDEVPTPRLDPCEILSLTQPITNEARRLLKELLRKTKADRLTSSIRTVRAAIISAREIQESREQGTPRRGDNLGERIGLLNAVTRLFSQSSNSLSIIGEMIDEIKKGKELAEIDALIGKADEVTQHFADP